MPCFAYIYNDIACWDEYKIIEVSMHKTKSIFVLAVLLALSVSYADGLCVQLCVDCSIDSTNATCAKVDQVCGNCPAILDSLKQDSLAAIARADSIQKEKERKDSIQKIDVRKLSEIIQKNCQADTCEFIVSVSDGLLGNVRGAKGNKAAKKPEAAKDSTVIALLPPMSEECVNFCGTCSEAEEGSANPICEKIETQCRCKDYAEQERQLAEKAKADSIADIEKKLAMMEASQTAAQEVFSFCEQNGKTASCSTSVKVLGENLSIAQIIELEKKAAVDTVAVQPEPLPKEKAPERKEEKVKPSEKPVAEPAQEKKNTYWGISLAYESFREKYFGSYPLDPDTRIAVGAHLGFLMRWYLYQWLSFQTGFNVVYHFGYYDFDGRGLTIYDYRTAKSEVGEGFVEFNRFLLDVPLQLRFIAPTTYRSKPFFSTSFYFRKPLYMYANYEVDWDDYCNKARDLDYFTPDDWEFLLYLGVGVEITRHFSIQWQIAPLYRTTYTYVDANYGEDTDVWRINIDIAW